MTEGQRLRGINSAKIRIPYQSNKLYPIFPMKFNDFESALSTQRLQRYIDACNGDSRKAMTLYRYNLRLSQEMFTLVSCFEVTLRNAIDKHLTLSLGADWLKDSFQSGGIFDTPRLMRTSNIIRGGYNRLREEGKPYTHAGLLSEMEFGVWKHMFSREQFAATGRTLLRVFPYKPTSTPTMQYNHTYMFNELDKVNTLRNRIAHHEPVCFALGASVVDTSYIRTQHERLHRLFAWMGFDSGSMLYGLDHVLNVCDKVDHSF